MPSPTARTVPAETTERGTTGERAPSPVALTVLTGVVIAVVIGLVLTLLIGWPGIVIGVVVGAAAGWALASAATPAILALAGGEPADPHRDARLVNLIEGLALTAGLAVPEVRVLPDATINGMAVGSADERPTLVVTRGLVDGLDRIGTEALIAGLFARLQDPAQPARCVAVTTIGLPRYLLDRLGAGSGVGGRDLRPEAQVALDAEAVALTRYPPGLVSALEAMRERGTAVTSVRRSTSHLWMAPADGSDPDQLELRADVLRER